MLLGPPKVARLIEADLQIMIKKNNNIKKCK